MDGVVEERRADGRKDGFRWFEGDASQRAGCTHRAGEAVMPATVTAPQMVGAREASCCNDNEVAASPLFLSLGLSLSPCWCVCPLIIQFQLISPSPPVATLYGRMDLTQSYP